MVSTASNLPGSRTALPVQPMPAGPDVPTTIEARVHRSLAEVAGLDWDGLCPGAAESYQLFRALETVPPPGFELGALTVADRDRMIASAPMFQARFRLDASFQGRARAISDRIHSALPALTSLRLIGIGSPLSDNSGISLAPGLSPQAAAAARGAILDRLARQARETRAQVLVLKSLGEEAGDWHDLLVARGYARIRSVPTVVLPLPYVSLDHYYASLPDKTAAYLKRKMRSTKDLRIEYRTSTEGLEDRIMALHDATLAQSAVDYGEFDKLHPDYFRRLMTELGDRARLMLCWKGDELLSFQVFLVGERRIIANKIGMKYPEARDHNLYFVNWLKMIEFATERDIPEIEMGATTYATKQLLGGERQTRWIYFRMRWPGIATMTRPLHRYFDFEANDPELRRLAAAGRAPDRP